MNGSSTRRSTACDPARIRLVIAAVAVVPVVATSAAVGRAEDRIAVLVGVGKYDGVDLAPLPRCEDDAGAIGRALGRLGFSVVTMTSSAALESRRPTRPEAILGQLEKRLADREAADTVVVAFLGHGVQLRADEADAGGTKELWLCPAQARLADRDTLLPLSAVLDRLEGCGAGRKLLLVDAFRDEAGAPRPDLLEPPGSSAKRPPIPAGIAAVFSCRPGERSHARSAGGQGIFTAAVLEYLEGRAPAARFPGDELVLGEFAAHVRSKTRDTAEVLLDRVQMPDVVLPAGPAGAWAFGSLATARTPPGGAAATASRAVIPLSPNHTGRRVAGKAIDDPARFAELDAAIAKFRAGDVEACRAALERAKAAEPRLPPTRVTMAKLWLGTNQLEPALAELEATITEVPGDPEPHLMLGDLAFQDRNIDESDARFRRATELTAAFTGSPMLRRDFEIRCAAGAAAVAEVRHQWEPARTLIARWLELDPRSVAAHQRMGIVLFKLGRTNEALAEFQSAKRLDPTAVPPELAMARLYDDAGLVPATRTMLERALAAHGHDDSVLLAAAQWHLSQNEIQAAMSLADRVLARNAGSLDAKLVRGLVALAVRDYPTAERHFTAAHTRAPDNFAATDRLALVLVESNESGKRARALELARANTAAYRDVADKRGSAEATLAWIHHRLGDHDETAAILGDLANPEKLDAEQACRVARIFAERGERTRAREILEAALADGRSFIGRSDAVALLATLRQTAP